MTYQRATVLIAVAILGLVACGGPAGGGGGGGLCASSGSGTLALDILGLPSGVTGEVTVSGPGGSHTVNTSQSLTLDGGSYTVEAAKATEPDPFVRTVFAATIDTNPVCVRAGEATAVEVEYQAVPSSHKLWTGDGSALLGFSADLLGSSGAPTATVAADAGGSNSPAFDQDGNLWVAGATTADPPLLRYPAGVLGVSGEKDYDIAITTPLLDVGFPRVTALAFDAAGDLWVGVGYAEKIVEFEASQLTASGTPVPAVEISGVVDPSSIAFDASGNLWTVSDGKVVKYGASRLTSSTSAAPDLVITAQSPEPVIDTLDASDLAFDDMGNLWVAAFADNVVYRLTATDLSGSGAVTLTPGIQVSITVTALLEGIAFDESGGLWLAYTAGNFARLSPTQLGVSSTPGSATVPETVISSPDVDYAGSFALYPAPADLPLYHSLP